MHEFKSGDSQAYSSSLFMKYSNIFLQAVVYVFDMQPSFVILKKFFCDLTFVKYLEYCYQTWFNKHL